MASDSESSDSSASSAISATSSPENQIPDEQQQLQSRSNQPSEDVASPSASEASGPASEALGPVSEPQPAAEPSALVSSSGVGQMSAEVSAPGEQSRQQSHPSASGGQILGVTSAIPQLSQSQYQSQIQTPPPIQFNTNGPGSPAVDGRVRNPVPGNLMAKGNATDGNFGVMQMNVRPVLDARHLAAKRTSEMTQAAAKMAGKNGYQSVKRSKLAWNPAEQQDSQAQGYMSPFAPQSAPRLSSSEVKTEQARLLTFLRSIHPVIVVDQLCKALAYFGGIPGAPPPPQDAYPASARSNGTGSNFVSWLSEIFPPADITKPPFSTLSASMLLQTPGGTTNQGAQSAIDANTTQPSANNAEPGAPVKRRRGRPKGSKSTKFRKDKGIKKGPLKPAAGGQPSADAESLAIAQASTDAQASVDAQPATDIQPSTDVQPSDTPLNAWASAELPNLAASQASLSQASLSQDSQPANTAAGGDGPGHGPDSSVLTTPGSSRKRGRPKGSRNRPKPALESQLPRSTPQESPTTQAAPAEGWAQGQVAASQESSLFPDQTQSLESNSISNPIAAPGPSQGMSSWANQSPNVAQQSTNTTTLTGSPSRKRKSTQTSQSEQIAGTITTEPMRQPQKRRRVNKDGQAESQPASIEGSASNDDLSTSPVLHRSMGASTPTQTSRNFNSQSPLSRQQLNNQAANYMMQQHQQAMQQASSQQQQTQQGRQQYPTQSQQQFQQHVNASAQTSNPQQANMQARGRKQLPGNQLAQAQVQQQVPQHHQHQQQHLQQTTGHAQQGFYGQQQPQQATAGQFTGTGAYGHNANLAGGRANHAATSFQHASGAASGGESNAVGGASSAKNNYLGVEYAMGDGTGGGMPNADMSEQMYHALGRQ